MSILEDWRWFEKYHRWALQLRIEIPVPQGSPLPRQTDWHVLLEPEYPLGSVKFFPSKRNGFSETFPHQLYNGVGADDAPWRTGEICLNTQIRKYDRYEDEPFKAEERLLWHCFRATEWVNDGAHGRLAKDGEPFEIPQFPGKPRDLLVAYAESPASLGGWQQHQEMGGIVELLPGRTHKSLFMVKRFLSLDGRELWKYTWGDFIEEENEAQKPRRGIWIRTPSIPVLSPWQAPATWGELRKAFKAVEIDLDPVLRACLAKMRDGEIHLCLLGFPIPEKVGGSSHNMYWQPLALPAIAGGNIRGFRNSERNHWRYDRTFIFSDSRTIGWIESENWDVAQVSTRGRLGDGIRSRSVLLIGAGAVGSALAELLVRGGLQKLVVLDSEDVQVGNLTRHTLTMEDIGSSKAVALAGRLNKVSPHASVVSIHSEFPPTEALWKQRVEQCDVVIDCTGSDEVVRRLEIYPWPGDKTFFSISVGFDARRIFCFAQKSRFSSVEFFERIGPWLQLERKENSGRELPREGIGCWNPVFPARADDVWLLVSCVVGVVDDLEAFGTANPSLTVFERVLSEGRSVGVKKSTSVSSQSD